MNYPRHQWQGVIEEYRSLLDISADTPAVTLGEGGTPLIKAEKLSARTGAQVWVKYEGLNPTASFKDRGMTMAITKAVAHGAKAVICASTGNTSASAAAYATKAGLTCAVLVPSGKIAPGKMSQAIAHGATLLEVDGNFDDCLTLCRKLSESYPVHLVNSVNPDRIEGQKTASFEIVDVLGDAPDIHKLPVGNRRNITAYWKGYNEYREHGSPKLPQMWGFQAAGAAPLVLGHRSTNRIRWRPPSASATPPAGRRPRRRVTTGGIIDSVTDTRSSPPTRSSRRRASSSSPVRPPRWRDC